MNKCIIGILPSYYCENENPYSEYYKYNCIFARKLLEAGGVPVGMMFNGNKLDYKVLDLYDGFLITGGNKINDFVYEILYYAYENNKPVLGICMGAESIDVFSLLLDSIEKNGGEVTREKVETYYKTIKEKYGSALRRLDPGNIHNNYIIDGNIEEAKHEITIASNTIASKIFPDKILVPSMHNYDFHAVGSHFKVSAKASDGVCEIIECVDPNKFIFGVHFHPELIKTEVFNYFIDRVKNSE